MGMGSKGRSAAVEQHSCFGAVTYFSIRLVPADAVELWIAPFSRKISQCVPVGEVGGDGSEPQIPPLRFGMTNSTVALTLNIRHGASEPQIPPLRYASVGMTNSAVALTLNVRHGVSEPQIPPLRYASVGMTNSAVALTTAIS
jgi:hypothetical protein